MRTFGSRHVTTAVLAAVALAVVSPALAQIRGGAPKKPIPPPPTGPVSHLYAADGETLEYPALGGHCPVAYFDLGKATKGARKFRVEFDGDVYYLSGAEAKKKFEADPRRFLPEFAGWCTTALGGSYGNRIVSDPTVFDVREGKLYLFSSQRAKRAYDTNPPRFINKAVDRFEEPTLDGYCPVAYQERNRAMKGYKIAKAEHEGNVYYFVNEQMRDGFKKDPDRYLPKYDGYCAEGVTRGKRYPADPPLFVVFGKRTYLFFDIEAKIKFLMNPAEHIRKADEVWAKWQAEEEK